MTIVRISGILPIVCTPFAYVETICTQKDVAFERLPVFKCYTGVGDVNVRDLAGQMKLDRNTRSEC